MKPRCCHRQGCTTTRCREFGRFVHRLRCRLEESSSRGLGRLPGQSKPRLSESVASLVARATIVWCPALSLSRMGEEFPAAMALEQERHPTLMYDYGRPLGPDPRVLALLAERLAEAAADAPKLRPIEEVMLAAQGGALGARRGARAAHRDGRDGRRAGRRGLHRPRRQRRGAQGLAACSGRPTPTTHDGGDRVRLRRPSWRARRLERCRRLGARRVIVVPYLLFAGGSAGARLGPGPGYGAGHPDLDIRCAEVIGDCEVLARPS
ncbi:sirohydrochlorin chelatase [Nonomuraea dietziae]|uniref:sirohydrochlorin chelatase n=1 Tax=Nonomuraea dietziae TaxID=65515 RepID=UPI0031CF3AE7